MACQRPQSGSICAISVFQRHPEDPARGPSRARRPKPGDGTGVERRLKRFPPQDADEPRRCGGTGGASFGGVRLDAVAGVVNFPSSTKKFERLQNTNKINGLPSRNMDGDGAQSSFLALPGAHLSLFAAAAISKRAGAAKFQPGHDFLTNIIVPKASNGNSWGAGRPGFRVPFRGAAFNQCALRAIPSTWRSPMVLLFAASACPGPQQHYSSPPQA